MMFHLVSSAELRLTQTFLFLPTKLMVGCENVTLWQFNGSLLPLKVTQ